MDSPREVKQVVYPEGMLPETPSRSSFSKDGDDATMAGITRDVDDDALSVLSMVSYPDPAGRKGFTVTDDEPAKTVYEAWEIIHGEDSVDWSTWKSIWGVKFGLRWKTLDDGFLNLNPLSAYDQEELADLYEKAVREYKIKNPKKGKPYAQDLANRVFHLEADIYNSVQHLMEDKMRATNKTPFRRREWRIVVLEEGEFQMTELLPERKKKGLFRRREKPAVSRFFIVLRGEEIKTTKEDGGWRLFNRHSNPWWRIDSRETLEARKEHREHFERVNRKLSLRRGPIVRNVTNVRRG
ncbi:hypothetical protein F5Y06DRAFT_259892 [Hypoxylon sp. FL0890]|nr:hypothetical protein F5Y06DRAFT_259892 [Hypoxylon sp. FL0890]